MAITKLVADSLGAGATPNQSAFKNIIINGDMSIAQRGTSFTGIGDGDSQYTLDRFKWAEEGATDTAEYTISQSTDVPTGQGFARSLKVDCTTADTSIDANNIQYVGTSIEGQNLQYLKYGTSNAESTTLSFWVKSNKTGTYGVALLGNDSPETQYSQTYSISSADTWEKKTLTFEGDTSQGFDNDNGSSLLIQWYLVAGTNKTSGSSQTWGTTTQANRAAGQTVNLADSTSNEWYITGVQLEAGTTASDFEFLPHDINLKRCQRYYAVVADRRTSGVNPIRDQRAIGIGTTHYPNQVSVQMHFPTEMRTVPSIDQASGTDYYQYYHETTGDNFDSFNSIGGNGVSTMIVRNTNQISASHGVSGTVNATSSGNSYVAFDAEL